VKDEGSLEIYEFYVVTNAGRRADPLDRIWTISNLPDKAGWETDGRHGGYGLPKAIADFLCAAANERLEREGPLIIKAEKVSYVTDWDGPYLDLSECELDPT
jgi:hypothetical protein